jgi:hypothetical protein
MLPLSFSRGDGPERAHLIGAGPDHAGRGFRHFIPCSGEVAEWFRNHQPGLLTKAVEYLHLRV